MKKPNLIVTIGTDNGYLMMGGEYFEWRAILGGQEYGLRMNAGISKGFDDKGIARCVMQMSEDIQRIVNEEA